MLQPRSAGQTTVVCDFLFAPDAAGRPWFDPSDAVTFWDLVNRQDWRIGESVQRGMWSFAAEPWMVRAHGGRLGRHRPVVPPGRWVTSALAGSED